ncbi:hypothetical protein J3E68DRAFT_443614 [Trichoderma sp. SZMC 28012]
MQSPSACAAYDASGKRRDTKPRATSNGHPSHGYSIDRFLTDQEQRCPPELGKIQSPAEAEAKMMTKLLAFERHFGSSDKSTGN